MKRIIFILTVIIFYASTLFAQIETIKVSIPRTNYSNFYIIDSNNDSILLTKEDDNRFLKMDATYEIVAGEGRKKDCKGEREKNKQYLINSSSDTLLTLRKSQRIVEFKDSTCFFRERTPNGWKYFDSNNTTVCEIELLWNDSVWSYELKYYKSDQKSKDLKKVNMLTLVRMAYYRSKCNCKSSDDDDFWFIMWLNAII